MLAAERSLGGCSGVLRVELELATPEHPSPVALHVELVLAAERSLGGLSGVLRVELELAADEHLSPVVLRVEPVLAAERSLGSWSGVLRVELVDSPDLWRRFSRSVISVCLSFIAASTSRSMLVDLFGFSTKNRSSSVLKHD